MTALAAGGFATAAAVFLPLVPAGFAAYLGVGSPWAIWGAAAAFSLLAGLWLSTWTQAAAMRAAARDESAGDALRSAWRQTPAFAAVLSLVMLAAGGGFVLLFVPGMILSALLFFAPYYQLDGEAEGLAAVELSYARARPLLGPVSGRLALIGLIAWIPSWIPYVGWLIGPLWAPFGLTACARLADDLKRLSPAPERPRLGAAIGALGLVLVAATFTMSYGAARAAASLYAGFTSGRMELKAPDAGTAQALMSVLQGHGTAEERRQAMSYVVSLSSSAMAAP